MFEEDEEDTLDVGEPQFIPYDLEEPSPVPYEGEVLPKDTPPPIGVFSAVEGEAQFVPYEWEANINEEPEIVAKSFEDIKNNPRDMETVRKFMFRVKGTDYKDKDDEETLDDFMGHMRWVHANEVSTLSEVYDMYNLDDEGKADYAAAYTLFEQTGNMFTTGTWGDLGSAAYDYAGAVLSSPSTWAGLGFGKIVGQAGSKVAQKAALETVMAGAASKGLSQSAKGQIQKEVVGYFARKNAVKATVLAGIAETTAAAVQDYALQHGKIEIGVQDDYSALQTGLTVALTAPLAFAPALTATRRGTGREGISGLGGIDDSIQKSRDIVTKRLDETITNKVAPSLAKKAVEWEKLLKGSTLQDPNREVRDQMVRYFFDMDDPDSFISQIIPVGARLDRSDGQSLTHALIEVSEGLSEGARKSLDDSLSMLDVSYTDFIQAVAKTMNEGGVNANLASQASRALDNLMLKGQANSTAYKNILSATRDGKKASPKDQAKVAGYIQSLWKRSLVSNIGTTVVNIKGWGMYETINTFAQLMHTTSLLGVGVAKGLMGMDSKAVGQAKALFQNMGYATRIAVDPFTTHDAFKKLIQEVAPKDVRHRVSHQFISGVDNMGAEAFNLKPKGALGKGAIKAAEGYVGLGQKMTLVNFQDVMTKSYSGMKELDKQSRLHLGIGLAETLRTGRIHELPHSAWDDMVKHLQDATFSRDYSRNGGMLGTLAEFSQRASNVPGLGLIYPFGRFVNSVIGFTWNYSPLGLAQATYKLGRRAFEGGIKGTDQEVDYLFRGAAGTATLLTLMQWDREKAEEGLQWNEVRDETGEVFKIDNMFPYSAYAWFARYWNSRQFDDSDLLKDGMRQLIVPAAVQDLSKKTGAAEAAGIMELIEFMMPTGNDEDDKEISKNLGDLLSGVGKFGAGLAAAFTRPLDTMNDALGVYGEAKGWNSMNDIDRKQLKGWDQVGPEFFRYTDSIFKFLGGGNEGEFGRELGPAKQSATQMGPKRPGDPLSTMTGRNVEQRRTNIDKVLGMANFPSYRADSFTTGVPEYDNWLNEVITPTLELRATRLLENELFKKAPPKIKKDMVIDMLTSARSEILEELTAPSNPDKRGPIFNLRKDIMRTPPSMREEALKELGWQGRELEDFSLYELEILDTTIDLTKKKYKGATDFK